MRRRYINPIFNALCLVALATLILAMVVTAAMMTWEHAINWPTATLVLGFTLMAVVTWKAE